jgi:GNAT superfamily N-acetyltransferase
LKLTFESTTHGDAETLVRMRIQAMRESLERIGRFDPHRARDRFISSFKPSECRFILIDGVSVGFVVVRRAESHLALDHLYVVPEHQKKGIGSAVLGSVLKDADAQSLAVKLGALRDSDSNRFYQRHGFVKTTETEWDIYYVRAPMPRQLQSHATGCIRREPTR